MMKSNQAWVSLEDLVDGSKTSIAMRDRNGRTYRLSMSLVADPLGIYFQLTPLRLTAHDRWVKKQ